METLTIIWLNNFGENIHKFSSNGDVKVTINGFVTEEFNFGIKDAFIFQSQLLKALRKQNIDFVIE